MRLATRLNQNCLVAWCAVRALLLKETQTYAIWRNISKFGYLILKRYAYFYYFILFEMLISIEWLSCFDFCFLNQFKHTGLFLLHDLFAPFWIHGLKKCEEKYFPKFVVQQNMVNLWFWEKYRLRLLIYLYARY